MCLELTTTAKITTSNKSNNGNISEQKKRTKPTTKTTITMKNNIKVTPLQVKGDVVPENRAEIESTIRKSLDTVVASDSVEVTTHQIDYMEGLYQKGIC